MVGSGDRSVSWGGNGGPQVDCFDERELFTHSIFSAVFIKLRKFFAHCLSKEVFIKLKQVSDKIWEKVWRIGKLFVNFDKIGCISTKKIKKRFFILFCLRFKLSLQRNIKERTNMNTIISKEEALRRLVATKESKRQRIAVLKERMKEKYVNSMGVEPENILFL